MLGKLKSMLGGHRILNRFQFRRIKLDDLAAFGTDHVVVMLMLVIVLVVRATVAEAHLARQSGLRQQPQRPIDCRLANARILRLHQAVKIFAGHVPFSAQEHVENQVALRGALQPFLLDVLDENFLLFSHYSTRGLSPKPLHLTTEVVALEIRAILEHPLKIDCWSKMNKLTTRK
jgi:hypothetical protein